PTARPTCLHSVPTRRSSDLAVPAQHHQQLLDPARRLPHLIGGFLGPGQGRGQWPRAVVVHRKVPRGEHQLYQVSQLVLVIRGRDDRTSTRLNSSHVSISYAV